MSALLRYALVKSTREHLLAGLLLAPLVLTCAPMLGVGVRDALRGGSAFPLHLPEASPEQTASIFGVVTVVVSALVAGAGAFWIFRNEIANRAVNFFFLARDPRAVAGASTVYGLVVGMIAHTLARTALTMLTASPQQDATRDLAVVAVLVWIASALGSFLVAISSEPGMLTVNAGTVLLSMMLLESANGTRLMIAAAAAALLLVAAPIVLRRRCAS